MHRFLRLVLGVVWMTGCVSWEPTQIVAPETVPTNRVIRVWTPQRSILLRAVQVTRDSLSGVPSGDRTTCATCRIAMPLSVVDSLESQTSNGLMVVILVVPFVFLVASVLTYENDSSIE